MTTKFSETFSSSDGKAQIHYQVWIPEEKAFPRPRAILQIAHGMTEHIDRYDEFARFLTDAGVLVVGNDHAAHGFSVEGPDDWGHFEPNKGRDQLIADMHTLRGIISNQWPGVPYFLLGHSMGSFLVRGYMTRHSFALAGVALSGTGSQPAALLSAGKALTSAIATFKGGYDKRSKLVDAMVAGANNKRIDDLRTVNDWTTRDTAIVDAYTSDPRCTFRFTLGGYHELFSMIQLARDAKAAEEIPRDLPLLFISGDADPVGAYGAGVKEAVSLYTDHGMEDIELHLYEDARHEVLNEINRDEVYADVLNWIDRVLKADSHE